MTTEPFYNYFVRSTWHGRVETPAAIGAKFLNTLDALSGIDRIFGGWKISDFPNPCSGDLMTDSFNIKATPLASARPRIAEIIEKYVARDDFNEPDPSYGYHARALTSEIGGPRVACLSVLAGGKGEGRTMLEFGGYHIPLDLTIVTYPLYKAALLAIDMRTGARRGPARRLSDPAPFPCRTWRSCPAWWRQGSIAFHRSRSIRRSPRASSTFPGSPTFRPNTPPASRCRATSSPSARLTAGF